MSDSTSNERPISLIGAGLAGSLMSVYLAQRGMNVDIYEKRPDMREAGFVGGRSINLALSTRGLNALSGVGLEEKAREMCIPMYGRMIHDLEGNTELQSYGREEQFINSISREGLIQMLVEEADTHDHIDVHFEQKCVDVALDEPAAILEDVNTGETRRAESQLVIGADGAFSQVRERLQHTDRYDYSQSFLSHGYKELEMPPGPGGEHRIDTNALHIWPRHDFMLIALPNTDGSFTVTLFLPFEGEKSFENLETERDVVDFFGEHFPDAVDHMPNLVETFFENPTGSLVTIRCEPYHRDGVLIIGDAAHAVVPFYGQGMNAAFEDCYRLDVLLDEFDEDWSKVLPAFSEERKPNADAIADLALYNYEEMRSKVADPAFLVRKEVNRRLHEWFGDEWIPLYSMVTFTNIPYAEARERARRQSDMLDKVLPEKPLDAMLEIKESVADLLD